MMSLSGIVVVEWRSGGEAERRINGPRLLVPSAARCGRRDRHRGRIYNGLALALPPRHRRINDLGRRVHVAVGRQELRLGGRMNDWVDSLWLSVCDNRRSNGTEAAEKAMAATTVAAYQEPHLVLIIAAHRRRPFGEGAESSCVLALQNGEGDSKRSYAGRRG